MKPSAPWLARVLACAVPLAACSSPAPVLQDGPLTPIGCFADVVADGDYEDGYSAQLWSMGGGIVGLAAVHRGPIGEAMLGVMDDVRHDPGTGRISFTAKLTVDVHSCAIHTNVPSHDVLSLDGVLTGGTLDGGVSMENQVDSRPLSGDFRGVRMQRDPGCALDSYANRAAWLRAWEPVLAARGPKW